MKTFYTDRKQVNAVVKKLVRGGVKFSVRPIKKLGIVVVGWVVVIK